MTLEKNAKDLPYILRNANKVSLEITTSNNRFAKHKIKVLHERTQKLVIQPTKISETGDQHAINGRILLLARAVKRLW